MTPCRGWTRSADGKTEARRTEGLALGRTGGRRRRQHGNPGPGTPRPAAAVPGLLTGQLSFSPLPAVRLGFERAHQETPRPGQFRAMSSNRRALRSPAGEAAMSLCLWDPGSLRHPAPPKPLGPGGKAERRGEGGLEQAAGAPPGAGAPWSLEAQQATSRGELVFREHLPREAPSAFTGSRLRASQRNPPEIMRGGSSPMEPATGRSLLISPRPWRSGAHTLGSAGGRCTCTGPAARGEEREAGTVSQAVGTGAARGLGFENPW